MDERDPIDRALSREPRVEPTPGFTHRVMREVHRVAEEPRPLSFPWHLFAPGLAALVLLLAGAVMAVARTSAPAADTVLEALDGGPAAGIGIAVASVVLSLLLARVLGRRRGSLGY